MRSSSAAKPTGAPEAAAAILVYVVEARHLPMDERVEADLRAVGVGHPRNGRGRTQVAREEAGEDLSLIHI